MFPGFKKPSIFGGFSSQETLEFALREYEGAVVVVSHDRWDTRNVVKHGGGNGGETCGAGNPHPGYPGIPVRICWIFKKMCFFLGYFLRIGILWDS